MNRTLTAGCVLVVAVASYALGAAETRRTLVDTYNAVADTILGANKAEKGIVKLILENHRDAALRAFRDGKWEDAAAEMALFANEGDNQVGGVRKRLLEGGHHHNAEGEAKGIYEEGYVIVTKDGKSKMLSASSKLLMCTDQPSRQAAWDEFDKVAVTFVPAR